MRPHQTNILLPALSLFLHKTLFAEVFGVNKVMSSTPAPAARPGNHIIPQARGELYDYYELRKSWRAPAPQILSLSLSSTTGSEGPDSRWHLKQLRSSYKTPCSFFIPHDLFLRDRVPQLSAQGSGPATTVLFNSSTDHLACSQEAEETDTPDHVTWPSKHLVGGRLR